MADYQVEEEEEDKTRGMTVIELRNMPHFSFKDHSDVDSCPICMIDFKDAHKRLKQAQLDGDFLNVEVYEKKLKIRKLKCEHTFCLNCIDKWLVNKSTCPMCNMNLR